MTPHTLFNPADAAADFVLPALRPGGFIQGDSDLMIATPLSHLMAGLVRDARIRIYPDAAHGFLFQSPAEVAADVKAFLPEPRP